LDLGDYLDDDAERQGNIYSLHGYVIIPHVYRVLVHSGDLTAGHYMAFIRPEKDGKWFKYDDDRVTPVTQKEALNDNYGDLNPGTRTRRSTVNAYMLVYIRHQDVDAMLRPVTLDDIPVHLKTRLETERLEDEKVRRDMEEQHLYVNVTVVDDRDVARNDGFDLYGFY
jgi:ubiquitin carboxyl-terminal hydrolase 7